MPFVLWPFMRFYIIGCFGLQVVLLLLCGHSIILFCFYVFRFTLFKVAVLGLAVNGLYLQFVLMPAQAKEAASEILVLKKALQGVPQKKEGQVQSFVAPPNTIYIKLKAFFGK